MRPKPVAKEHQRILETIGSMCGKVAMFDHPNQFLGGLLQVRNAITTLYAAAVQDQKEQK